MVLERWRVKSRITSHLHHIATTSDIAVSAWRARQRCLSLYKTVNKKKERSPFLVPSTNQNINSLVPRPRTSYKRRKAGRGLGTSRTTLRTCTTQTSHMSRTTLHMCTTQTSHTSRTTLHMCTTQTSHMSHTTLRMCNTIVPHEPYHSTHVQQKKTAP